MITAQAERDALAVAAAEALTALEEAEANLAAAVEAAGLDATTDAYVTKSYRQHLARGLW